MATKTMAEQANNQETMIQANEQMTEQVYEPSTNLNDEEWKEFTEWLNERNKPATKTNDEEWQDFCNVFKKATILAFWIFLCGTPFAIGICSDSILAAIISIIYSVIIFNVAKRFAPEWLVKFFYEFVNDEQ